MTDLEKLVLRGILKDKEEIYLECKGNSYSGRILKGGKIIVTRYGEHKSLSDAAGVFFKLNEEEEKKKINPDGKYTANGWHHWKTWNGIPLKNLRVKLND